MIATTPFFDTLRALRWFKVPPLICNLVMFTYRFIFVLLDEMGRMRLARKSRGFTGGRSLLDKEAFKTISYTIGMVFVRSNVRAGKIYDALLSRGYSGEIKTLTMLKVKGAGRGHGAVVRFLERLPDRLAVRSGPMDVMKLQNVWYRYPESPFALEDISLAIAKGERVSLVGPNGAGKSTLLHLMAGLYYPTKGKLEVEGTLLTKKEARSVRQKVGFLFQDPDDQIFMPTVWEDVAFGPINMGMEETDVKERVAKAMELAGIADFKDRVPHRLSIGEKKRVAIAGLLAMSPPMLLLDEPTANLDPQGRRDLVNILESLDQGFVLATHDLSVAFELTDRVIVLKKKVIFDGDFRALVDDQAVLKEANLELPSFSRLMTRWRDATKRHFPPPLTVEEALAELLRQR